MSRARRQPLGDHGQDMVKLDLGATCHRLPRPCRNQPCTPRIEGIRGWMPTYFCTYVGMLPRWIFTSWKHKMEWALFASTSSRGGTINSLSGSISVTGLGPGPGASRAGLDADLRYFRSASPAAGGQAERDGCQIPERENRVFLFPIPTKSRWQTGGWWNRATCPLWMVAMDVSMQ